MKHRKILTFSLLILLFFSHSNFLYAWNDTNTHPQITGYVINETIKQQLENYLKIRLAFNNTIGEEFYEKYSNGKPKGNPISFAELIAKGATYEDLAERTLNHFYNPVSQELNGGGVLNDYALGIHFLGKYANPDWGSVDDNCNRPVSDSPDEKSNTCNDFSWIKARDAFRMALTGKTNEDRDKMFIRSFRSLGQVVHLMQDMAVPAHTRNDMKGHVHARKFMKLLKSPRDWRFEL